MDLSVSKPYESYVYDFEIHRTEGLRSPVLILAYFGHQGLQSEYSSAVILLTRKLKNGSLSNLRAKFATPNSFITEPLLNTPSLILAACYRGHLNHYLKRWQAFYNFSFPKQLSLEISTPYARFPFQTFAGCLVLSGENIYVKPSCCNF